MPPCAAASGQGEVWVQEVRAGVGQVEDGDGRSEGFTKIPTVYGDSGPISRIQSTSEEVDAATTRAAEAQQWAAVPLAERIAIGHKFIEDFTKLTERIPQELTKMMGRILTSQASVDSSNVSPLTSFSLSCPGIQSVFDGASSGG
ncbi:hypothetical protein B0H13DRAFT_1909775 [Mycena leptocephala]|nr:hypothetical protein B0H13DRAFT_1909775 [Mycena leptocephala]